MPDPLCCVVLQCGGGDGDEQGVDTRHDTGRRSHDTDTDRLQGHRIGAKARMESHHAVNKVVGNVIPFLVPDACSARGHCQKLALKPIETRGQDWVPIDLRVLFPLLRFKRVIISRRASHMHHLRVQ